MNGNTQGTIAESQLRALAGGKYKCRTTHFSDHCHQIVDVQVELGLTEFTNQIISAIGGIVESDDPGYIIAEAVKTMGLKESAEGAGCNYTPMELQGLISTKEDFKETVCVTTKEINRNNAVALAQQSRKMTLNLVRRLLHLLLEALDRLHRSAYNPFYNSVDPETVNEMYRKSFGALNRGTACAAEVVAEAISIIKTAAYDARILIVPPSVIPRLDAGDEVALNTDYVGENGFLSFTSPRARLAKTFGGLAVVPSTGLSDDPLISQVCNPEHFVNSAIVCGSFDRAINIYNHDSGHVEPVDLRAAVDALGVFGDDGHIVQDVYDIVAEYNATRSTPWHKDNCLNTDPLEGKTMGPLTFRNRAGDLEVSRFLGHMPVDRNGLQKFADSVFVNLGSRKADVVFHMRRLESILKQINNSATSDAYWTALVAANQGGELAATFQAEDGSYRDARGNAYGVLNHPWVADTVANAGYSTIYDGYQNGPGLAYLAASGRSSGIRQLEEIAEVYDSCEFLGNELAVVLPESQFFARRPAWFHGEYTPGMAVVDMLVPGYVNLVRTNGASRPLGFPAVVAPGASLDDIRDYSNAIVDVVRSGTSNGAVTAADTQTALIALLGTPGARDIVLPALSAVGGLVGSTGFWGDIATFDFRAAKVFDAATSGAAPTSTPEELKEKIHLLIALWDNWPGSTVDINMDSMESKYVQGTRHIIQRVAAAVAQGVSPVGAEDVGVWFQTRTPNINDAEAILNSYPLTALTAGNADNIRLPLTLAGRSATNANLAANLAVTGRLITTSGARNNLAQNSIYASRPVGAQFGAGASSSTGGATVIETVVGAVSAPVFQDNYAAANSLNVASKIASRALLHTPITAGSLRALVDCVGAFYPFSFKLLRAPSYRRSESAYVVQGGADTIRVYHDPVQVIQGYDKCGSNFLANLNLSAVGIVLAPASTIKLPHFHLSDPAPGTADTSFRDEAKGYGAIIPSLVELNFRAPEELPLSGINAMGELVDGSAVLLHSLFDLESFAPTEHMWKHGCKASYQGKQETRDRYNACKSLASKGPSCTA